MVKNNVTVRLQFGNFMAHNITSFEKEHIIKDLTKEMRLS